MPSSSRSISRTPSARLIAQSKGIVAFLVDMSLTHVGFGSTAEGVVIRWDKVGNH